MMDAAAPPIRVLCVDDHPLIRKGIASILANERDMQLVGEAATGSEAVRLYRSLRPDVTLMDLRMPELDGIAATQQIRREFADARIIALTSYDGDQDIYRAIDAGVRGYLLKESVHANVLHAIRTVQAGRRLMPSNVAARMTLAADPSSPRAKRKCSRSSPTASRTARSRRASAPQAAR